MANTIEYAKVFQTELDTQMIAELTTGWMDGNAKMAKYAGGNEIKIPSIAMSGLGDYSRSSGYVEGDVTLSWETMSMTQDRGRGFTLDAMDVDESGFVLAAGTVMGEFQRTKVVPEVDAYRISRIVTLADDRVRSYAPATSSILAELKADIAAVQDKIGENEPLVCMISIAVASLLDNNEAVAKHLTVSEFERGGITLRVKTLDTVPLLRIPSARMKTAYDFADGTTTGQEAGGFAAAEDAVGINWIICAKAAPIAVCKTDTVRVFDPVTYQKANAWHIDYRKYHDLWIPANKLDGVFANLEEVEEVEEGA